MILVDTSVWVDHFRKADARLERLLLNGEVLAHPLVVGELACGNLRDRATVLRWLNHLPCCAVASQDEVLLLVDRHRLWGRGIGWVDVHLLASALLAGAKLWTADRRLHRVASSLAVSWP